MYSVEKLEWDSNHFNLKIGNLKFTVLEKSEAEDFDIIFAKVETKEWKQIEILEKENFLLKDILITFSGDRFAEIETSKNIHLLENKDLREVQLICENAFLESHFYKNSKLKKEKINMLYKKWIKNKFTLGEKIYIYKKNEEILGFLLEKRKENEATIDLIAVKEDNRGQKIGQNLIVAFINENKQKFLNVGTQITNKSAIRLYEKMGFRFEKTINIYHKNKEQ
ncbi:MAG: GNAT family N-acetyltransferase [Cetobacterium sp.]